MTNEITLTKAEFALDLTALGFDVIDFQPGRVNAPQLIIRAASPYLQTSSIGNEYEMALEILVVSERAENEEATEQLDEMLANLLAGLPNYATLTGVDTPYALNANNADYLTSNVNVSLSLTL